MKMNIFPPSLLRLAGTVLAITVLISCGKEKAESGLFDYDKPVDMTAIVEAYQWQQEQEDEVFGALYDKILPDLPDDDVYLFCDTSFVLRLPEYSQSSQPFLAQSEDFFNSLALAWNVYSNYEVYFRGRTSGGLYGDEDASHCTESISVDMLNHEAMREAAQVYEDSILTLMELSLDEMSDDNIGTAMSYIADFCSVLDQHTYHFYNDEDSIINALETVKQTVEEMAEDKFQHYLKADEDHQLKVILDEMNSCDNFDEQCSLWLRWANCEKSVTEDDWLVATGCLLMKSGCYNPLLNRIWIGWRALCQTTLFGNSRDSSIPNDYYNSYRQLCYKTALKRIERHPDDDMAMCCAAAIAGRTNINRYGQNYLGNEAMIEEMMSFPNRFSHDDEEDDDE